MKTIQKTLSARLIHVPMQPAAPLAQDPEFYRKSFFQLSRAAGLSQEVESENASGTGSMTARFSSLILSLPFRERRFVLPETGSAAVCELQQPPNGPCRCAAECVCLDPGGMNKYCWCCDCCCDCSSSCRCQDQGCDCEAPPLPVTAADTGAALSAALRLEVRTLLSRSPAVNQHAKSAGWLVIPTNKPGHWELRAP